jgi:lipopolysaccharide assembly outer membrane protein LptD (OstA)
MRNLPPLFVNLLASSAASPLAAAEGQPSAPSSQPAQSPLSPQAATSAGTAANPTAVSIAPENPQNSSGTIVIEGLTGESEMVQSLDEGLTYYRHGVVVRYDDMELTADQVALSEATGDIIADGNVQFRGAKQSLSGEHLEYNFKTGMLTGNDFRAGFTPFFAGGLSLDADVNAETFRAHDAYVTTDDVKNPGFRIRAKQFRVVAGKSVEAKNATVYVEDTPVFFLPYYKRTFIQHPAYWRVTPGARSFYGPFLRTAYRFPVTTNVLAGVDIDLFSERGIGFGPALEWDLPKLGKGSFSYWQIDDQNPDVDPFKQPIPDDRHRISFSHQVLLRTNLTAKVVLKEQSDPYVVRDFFETEYRKDPQPKSFLEVNQAWSNWSLDLMAQPQVNDFYQTVERLPDLKLSGIRQEIGETPLYYESDSSLGYFRFQPGDQTPLQPALTNTTSYAAMRFDSFHQILWPQTYFGWLNFVPRVGGRLTQYGETEGDQVSFNDRTRFVFNTGAETSMKASRVWRNVESDFWDVRELRHIVEPSINYVFVPTPNYQPFELPQFDQEIPSLRLLPIEFPDYNAIDQVDAQNVVRLTLRNKLQTKRDGEVQNVVNWAVYTDLRLDPRPDQTQFSGVYSDLDLRPKKWLSLSSQTRYDTEAHQFDIAYHTATIAPNSTWNWTVGHLYFRGGPEFGPDSDNNTIFSSIYFKLNENWGTRFTHRFEARDGTMEEQYYTLYHDFRSWTGAFTFRVREDRLRGTEYAVAFTFQLKAFPMYRRDFDEHSFLHGS